jgi:outer membrane lipoprotein-sorting protein
MKTLSALFALILLGAGVQASAADSQAERDQQQMAALTKEIQTQQAAIADNQKKIDEKTAAIGEALRVARIYAGRGR